MERTFRESAWKIPKVIDKPITKIINNLQNIKIGQFIEEELDVVLLKIKKNPGNMLVLMKYLQKYGRQGNTMTYCSDTATPYVGGTQ